jgi:amidase
MSWDEWFEHDALALAGLVRDGRAKAVEVVAQAVEGARLVDPQLDAVLEYFEDVIADPDREGSRRDGPLYGVPFFLKDLGGRLKGRLQEQGTAFHAGEMATVTDPFVQDMLDSGVIPIGRTTVPPMGYTMDTTTTYRGRLAVTRNPWSLEYTPGGSSGGAGALVAAGVTPMSHATDGGGSIRYPAAFNGLVGLKPSRGASPRRVGVNEFVNHTSIEGVVSRTVRDTAAALDAMWPTPNGASFMKLYPPGCSTGFLAALEAEPGSLRIALSTGRWGLGEDTDPELVARVREVARVLEGLGHRIEEVPDGDICDFEALGSGFRTLWIANTGRMQFEADTRGLDRDAFGALMEPMLRAQFEASEKYTKHDIWRAMMKNPVTTRQFGEFFERYDLLLTPTAGFKVPLANGPYSMVRETDFEAWFDLLFSMIRYTYPANECGFPAATLPAGLDSNGLPIGAQLHGDFRREDVILQAARQLEMAKPDWFAERPPVWVGAAI